MKSYLKIIAILLFPLAFIFFYANSSIQIPPPGWKLSKAHISIPSISIPDNSALVAEDPGPSSDSTSLASTLPSEEEKALTIDTTSHRILFFGDSMVEGLLRRMNCYAYANGYQMTNIVWYSSTTELWAKTDTLRYFLDKVKPTFVMVSLGANEQITKNPSECEAYIRQIIHEFGKTPFVWIGVPAWREDTGINDLTQQVVGKNRYFDSRGLTLQRGRDRMHPTFNAASLWMDTVAVWMSSPATAHPIRMNKPTDGRKHTYKTYALQPMKI